jgi:ketosteroid isomerase-like protein
MSRQNVETLRRCLDNWSRGDFDAWLADAHPKVEYSSPTTKGLRAVSRRGGE